jgi:uncharacterized protein YodC (DUF2158 family)
MSDQAFNVGDAVVPMWGGPKMVVDGVQFGSCAVCWFVGNELHREEYRAVDLILVPTADGIFTNA